MDTPIMEHFELVDESGVVLERVSGLKQFPFPYNKTVSLAKDYLPEDGDGILYVVQDGKRLSRISGTKTCYMHEPL